MYKFEVKIHILFIILLGSLFYGCQPQQASLPPPLPEVATISIQAERIVLTTELPGRVYPYCVAEIRPQISGIIQKRYFEEGSDVRAGDLLYQIDPAPFQAAYENALANLNAMRKAADRARAALEASLANVERQKVTLDLLRTNSKRFEELVKEGAVSASERDQAVTEVEVGEATLRALEAQVKSEREAVGMAEASIKQAEAALESARINLGYTRITAPISGRIGKSNVTVGAMVTAYQPIPLTIIQQINPIYVDATQSSVNLLQLKRKIEKGQIKGGNPNRARVRLIMEDGTPYQLEGTLKFSDISVDPTTGSFILRMVFPNPKYILLPGMYVRAIVHEGMIETAILVPQQSVSRNLKGNPIVLIVNPQGIVEQRLITLDRAIGDKWLVTSGISPGDQIIVEGLQKVRPGMQVKLIPYRNSQKELKPTY